MLFVPTFDGVALAVLFLGAILRRHELGKQRDDLGVPGRHDRRRQHGVIALDLAVGALARQAMRAAELLRTEIFRSIPGDQGPSAKPAKSLAHWRLGEQLLEARETGLQQRRVRRVQHVADIIVGGNLLDPEQRLAVRTTVPFLQCALKRQEGRTLHEKHREGGEAKISHRNIASTPLPGVRKRRTNSAQIRQKGRQKPHPHPESLFR